MTRTIEDHKVREDEQLTITVTDEPGPGGACHRYLINGMNMGDNPSRNGNDPVLNLPILFQQGGIHEHGVNGITQEALLAIVIDRLRSFQAGPFRCRENAIALTSCEEALMWLQSRTRDRLSRGVEGEEKA